MDQVPLELLKLGPKFLAAGVLIRAAVQFVKGFHAFKDSNVAKAIVLVLSFLAAHFYRIQAGEAVGLVSGVYAVDTAASAVLLAYWSFYLHDRLKNGNGGGANGH